MKQKYRHILLYAVSSLIAMVVLYFAVTTAVKLFLKKNEQSGKTSTIVSFADSSIAAIVNGEAIHFDKLEKVAQQLILQAGLADKVSYKDSVIQQQALEWMIANTLLQHETKNQVIEITKDEVAQAVAQLKRNFPSEDKFIEALRQQNLSLREFEENVLLELKVQKLLQQQIMSQTEEIKNDEAREFYHKNIDKFQKYDQARVQHILIRVNEKASKEETDKAYQKAKAALEKLKKGDDFAAVARIYSEDPAAAKGGDLGYFSRGDMLKSFEDQVFSLKVGEMSDVFRTELGFQIVKLEDLKKGGYIPFDEKEKEIKAFLYQQKSNQLFEKYIERLKQKATIQIRENV